MTLPNVDLLAILPQIIIVAGALLVLMADALLAGGQARRHVLPSLTLLTLLVSAAAALWLGLGSGAAHAFQNMAVADGYATAFALVILAAAVLGVLLAWEVLPQVSQQLGSYYALLLLAVSGMITMAAATDLVVVFLALEILSLALYILVGFNRQQPRSAEASLKYFLLGAFASGFFLYGAALIYGATGTTNLSAIAAALTGRGGSDLMLYGGTALLIVGFGFKVALVPFHMWTPDAYQGAPTPVTAFMSVGAKAAGFAAFLRVFFTALPVAHELWGWAVAVLAALTMTLGNIAALRQLSLKRMLAYSSIAHAGYAAVGLVAGTGQGLSAVLFYLFAYTFMNIGAFAVVTAAERSGENDVMQGQLAGLADRQPLLAAATAVFMFSLAGVPPLAGFFGKFYVFSAAMAGGWGWLVVIGVVNSVISAFYYLRVTVEMYFAAPLATLAGDRRSGGRGGKKPVASEAEIVAAAVAEPRPTVAVAVLLATLGTLLIGLWPYPWVTRIADAVRLLAGG